MMRSKHSMTHSKNHNSITAGERTPASEGRQSNDSAAVESAVS